ncbi:MAG: glutaredoxin 3 [Mucilaginibacter sp.]|nr:glutaredoxin 3 [Mucilaginibacter sp.]
MNVEIYTKPACPYCSKAKWLLDQKNIPYKEYDLGAGFTKEDIQQKIKSLGLNTEIRTVPQIFYTDKSGKTIHVGGYTDLVAKQSILGT